MSSKIKYKPDETAAPRHNILLLEEDWSHLEELYMILKMENLNVFPVTSPSKAMEQINDIQPHLLIIGINRPFLPTLEFLKLVKKIPQYEEMPVLAFTDDRSLRLESISRYNVEYLFQKPFSVDILIKAIHKLLK
ncbi:MAG: response regulator [Candidatus Cyclobacteriaceae bacterium M2_1C_046]